MRMELKITLPIFKLTYSLCFMGLMVLIRPVVSPGEILAALEPQVSLLAGIFMADNYYKEFSGERIACYYRYSAGRKYRSVLIRTGISLLYLLLLTALFYWGFVLIYRPMDYAMLPGASLSLGTLYGKTLEASAMSMLFFGAFSFSLTNLTQNMGIGIGGGFLLWLFLTSSWAEKLPELLQVFRLTSTLSQDGGLIPDFESRIFYAGAGALLLAGNYFLVKRQPKEGRIGKSKKERTGSIWK